MLLEGSQGTLLDVDHGTYPFVTSSNPTAGGASVGSGIGPTRITTVLGILKAYTTRVGSGPFPTELFDEFGAYLSKTGGEVGVTTGRPRRCGWFDAVIARYATRVNGITDYFLTKLDVLSSLETVPVCVGYTVDGKRTDEMPMTQSEIARAEPILRGTARLVGGHLSTPRVRRPARQGTRLRASARRACRSSCFVHRRGPGPRADDRATRHPGGRDERPRKWTEPRRDERSREEQTAVTDDPRVVDPDYDRHGGFPNFQAGTAGSGLRAVPDGDASRAGPGGVGRSRHRHLGAGRRPRRGHRRAARPVPGGRGRRPRQPGARVARAPAAC